MLSAIHRHWCQRCSKEKVLVLRASVPFGQQKTFIDALMDVLFCNCLLKKNLIRQFDVEYGWIFLRFTLYFDEPSDESKYKLTSKNIRPYSALNCLISELFSNEFKTYTKEENFRKKYINF